MGELKDVPPEIYLRELRDTDPRDPESLVDLCRHGMFAPPGDFPAIADLPVLDFGTWRLWVQAVIEHLGLPFEVPTEEPSFQDATWHLHVAEVALRVLLVQTCTNHLLAYRAGDAVTTPWKEAPRLPTEPLVHDERSAWGAFSRYTGAALRDFHVRVVVPKSDRVPRSDDWGLSSIYSVAMLQLVNDLAADIPFRSCANEPCRRPFVRQLGRVTKGSNRTQGVIYCSSSCARAQYQREKRRRDRAAKRTEEAHE